MTFETGTATDLEDLLSKLDTFATTTHGGWVSGYSPNPDTTNRYFELHRASISCSMSMRYEATPNSVSVHHALTYLNSSTAPGSHTDDSGNGYNAGTFNESNIRNERCLSEVGNGPFPSYHFFALTAGVFDYIHVVLQVSTGVYRHLNFGLIEKRGDWTGGSFVCGHEQGTSPNPTQAGNTLMFDGLATANEQLQVATVHAQGLPNQAAASRFLVVVQDDAADLDDDTAGNPRYQAHGGWRGGMEARGFGNPVGSFSAGQIPMYAIPVYYRDPNNTRVYPLGWLPDVRALNIRNFDPGQEVTSGSDTWVMFPMSRKSTQAIANSSDYSGFAYRKVV